MRELNLNEMEMVSGGQDTIVVNAKKKKKKSFSGWFQPIQPSIDLNTTFDQLQGLGEGQTGGGNGSNQDNSSPDPLKDFDPTKVWNDFETESGAIIHQDTDGNAWADVDGDGQIDGMAVQGQNFGWYGDGDGNGTYESFLGSRG